jgi:hypothetical protein
MRLSRHSILDARILDFGLGFILSKFLPLSLITAHLTAAQQLQFNNAALEGSDNRVGAIAHTQFRQNIVDMELNCTLAYTHCSTNRLISLA